MSERRFPIQAGGFVHADTGTFLCQDINAAAVQPATPVDDVQKRIEASYCDICMRHRPCCCKGIQPFSMSNYPGEHKLVKTHPTDEGELWYRRVDVDARIEELEKEIMELKGK